MPEPVQHCSMLKMADGLPRVSSQAGPCVGRTSIRWKAPGPEPGVTSGAREQSTAAVMRPRAAYQSPKLVASVPTTHIAARPFGDWVRDEM